MTKRFGKKWLVFIFVLLSLVLWAGYGYVNSDDYLASQHNAITLKEWSKISAEELADALEKGEFNPDQLVLKTTSKGLVISPALIIASINGQLEHLRLLLDYGAQVDLIDNHVGHTALHAAAWQGQVEAAEVLLKSGADPNSRNEEIELITPLHSAIMGAGYNEEGNTTNKQLERMIALLVKNGADINAVDKIKNNLLYYLISNGRMELVNFAVQMGANIDWESDIHLTPLMYIVMYEPNRVSVVLSAGADINYRTINKSSALDIAQLIADPTVVIDVLLRAKVKISKNALQLAKLRANGNIEIYKVYSSVVDLYQENMRSVIYPYQSIEEWQQKGQEAVDMLLAHGAKDDGGVLDDEAIASLAAVFAGFQSRVRGINHGR